MSNVRPHRGTCRRLSSNIYWMQVTTGTVVGGKIVVEGGDFFFADQVLESIRKYG